MKTTLVSIWLLGLLGLLAGRSPAQVPSNIPQDNVVDFWGAVRKQMEKVNGPAGTLLSKHISVGDPDRLVKKAAVWLLGVAVDPEYLKRRKGAQPTDVPERGFTQDKNTRSSSRDEPQWDPTGVPPPFPKRRLAINCIGKFPVRW